MFEILGMIFGGLGLLVALVMWRRAGKRSQPSWFIEERIRRDLADILKLRSAHYEDLPVGIVVD